MMRLRLPLAIAHRVLIDFFRDRRSRVVLIVTPGILMILGRYMYSTPAAFDRTGSLMLGVFPALSMFLTGSTAVVHERGEGTLEKVLTTPASRKDLVAGYVIAAAAASLAQAAVTVTLAYEVCQLTTQTPAWLIYLLTALCGVFGMSLGICASAVSKNEGEAEMFLPGAMVPQLLLCGVFWPVSRMDTWVHWLADFLPITALANTMTSARLHFYGGLSMVYSLIAMAGIIVISLIVAVRVVGVRAVTDLSFPPSIPRGNKMFSPAIEIRDLVVHRGGRPIINGVSVSVEVGAITGLLGPSGSGKTTLMRCIMGVQRIRSGEVIVLGRPAGTAALRREVGYLSQPPSAYAELTVEENVRHFAALYGYGKKDAAAAIEDAGLADVRKQYVRTLSSGQRTRAALACALVGRPRVLILDEPTVGQDPVLRRELWQQFRRLADSGVTILISSHVMEEAARCDRILLIRGGIVIAHDAPDLIQAAAGAEGLEEAFVSLVEAG
jgi:ABC-2 type transport system ATP-binding protein